MSVPYIPLYVADYEADTAHLSLEEDGAYMRLLRLCWRTSGCSIPDDREWIMRKMRVDPVTYHRLIEPLIEEFFSRAKGRIYSARLTKEWQRINDTHRKRSEAGFRGGKAKALKSHDNGSGPALAKGKQLEPEPEPEPEGKKEGTDVPSKKRGTRLPDGWALPKEWLAWAVSEGWPERPTLAEAEKFRDFWRAAPGQKGVKLDWQATWRNWMRNSKVPKVVSGGADSSLDRVWNLMEKGKH